MGRNSTKVTIRDQWFKVRIEEHQSSEVNYSYLTGDSLEGVRSQVSRSLGEGYQVFVKPIEYDTIVREVSKEHESQH